MDALVVAFLLMLLALAAVIMIVFPGPMGTLVSMGIIVAVVAIRWKTA